MKAIKFIAVLVALSFSMSAMCQTKDYPRSVQKKIESAAKKEAKKMEKEGWKTTGLPLEQQLYRYFAYQYDFDENNHPNYFFGVGMSTGGNFDAARMQATELARSEIGRSMDSDGTSLIENMMGNEQIDKGEAASISTMVGELKVFSSQHLKGVMTVVEAYRDLPNKNREVQMRLAHKDSASEMLETAKNALREELKKGSRKLSEKAKEFFDLK